MPNLVPVPEAVILSGRSDRTIYRILAREQAERIYVDGVRVIDLDRLLESIRLLAESRKHRRTPKPVTYMGIHKRLERARGSASGYPCQMCGGTAFQWAFDGSTQNMQSKPRERSDNPIVWSTSIDDYFPACAKCHDAYDQQMRASRAA